MSIGDRTMSAGERIAPSVRKYWWRRVSCLCVSSNSPELRCPLCKPHRAFEFGGSRDAG